MDYYYIQFSFDKSTTIYITNKTRPITLLHVFLNNNLKNNRCLLPLGVRSE